MLRHGQLARRAPGYAAAAAALDADARRVPQAGLEQAPRARADRHRRCDRLRRHGKAGRVDGAREDGAVGAGAGVRLLGGDDRGEPAAARLLLRVRGPRGPRGDVRLPAARDQRQADTGPVGEPRGGASDRVVGAQLLRLPRGAGRGREAAARAAPDDTPARCATATSARARLHRSPPKSVASLPAREDEPFL
eukprot:1012121-Prymnesium_polylepis.1